MADHLARGEFHDLTITVGAATRLRILITDDGILAVGRHHRTVQAQPVHHIIEGVSPAGRGGTLYLPVGIKTHLDAIRLGIGIGVFHHQTVMPGVEVQRATHLLVVEQGLIGLGALDEQLCLGKRGIVDIALQLLAESIGEVQLLTAEIHGIHRDGLNLLERTVDDDILQLIHMLGMGVQSHGHAQ